MNVALETCGNIINELTHVSLDSQIKRNKDRDWKGIQINND